MITFTPFLVLFLGLCMFLFCKPKYPDASHIGEIMIWCGLLVTLLERGALLKIISN